MTADLVDLADFFAANLGRYELTLVRRRDPRSPTMRLPDHAARFLRREVLAEHRREELLGALFVDSLAAPLAYSLPYLGYLDRMRIDSQRLHAPAVVLGAAGLILFHYQPGEAPWLSDRDVEVAELFRNAGEVVGVRLVDYLALGADDSWLSLRRRGWIKLHGLGEDVPRPALKPRLRPDDKRRRVRPKYVNPANPEQTWSGRGNRARWLDELIGKGAKLEDFRIEE